MQQQTKLC